MKLFEIRSGSLNHLRQRFSKMPPYVLKDLMYQAFKKDPTEDNGWTDYVSGLDWKKETINVTLEVFDSPTQRILKERMGGVSQDFVPNDQARHTKQQELLSSGPATEPIIVIETNGGYTLEEGWHRTIQSLKKWPTGYKQNAWIGYE